MLPNVPSASHNAHHTFLFPFFFPSFRRAKSEHVSAIKAMQARQKKGLLTQSEQVKLAEEMAKLHMSNEAEDKKKKDDCTIA